MNSVTTQFEGSMASAALKSRYTPEEYLALERQAEYKSEYFDGFIRAISGVSKEHNTIALNIASSLNRQLAVRACDVFMSDFRVCVDATGAYTYPDVMVVCGEPQFLDANVDTLLNPTMIVEVLSPSTESYDRGAKFRHYRRLPSLKEYMIVPQDQFLVERYIRRVADWILTDFRRLEDTLSLLSIDCEMRLSDIYAKVPLERLASD